MLHFEPFITSRLRVSMRELAIGDAMSILLMPAQKTQACITAFLRSITTDAGPVPNPLDWTLQERTLAVCQYLLSVNEKEPNFRVGNGHFSDYAHLTKDIPAGTADSSVELLEIGGDKWRLQHLNGYMLESIERLYLGQAVAVPGGDARLHWLFCAMGAQLIREGEEVPAFEELGKYDDWLAQRTAKLQNLPESAFAQLLVATIGGRERLFHFFDYGFEGASEQNAGMGGVVFFPKEDAVVSWPEDATQEQKEAGAVMHPATFSPLCGVSGVAYSVLGKVPK